MELRELIKANRSTRRFHQDEPIDSETLKGLVDLARLSASGGNLQPLKFLLSNDPEKNSLIFKNLAWAAYLKDWPGPVEGERPAAYLIILCDKNISKSPGCDHGIAAQSIMLGAAEKGLGGCMIGSINKENLREDLKIDPRFDIVLVLALGKPKEKVKLEQVGEDGNIRYWRDREGVHHVPKRALHEIIIP
jgi:nitroreductase